MWTIKLFKGHSVFFRYAQDAKELGSKFIGRSTEVDGRVVGVVERGRSLQICSNYVSQGAVLKRMSLRISVFEACP